MSEMRQWTNNTMDTSIRNYPVKEEVAKGVYIGAERDSVFGKLNKLRNVDVVEIVAGGGTKTIGSGRDSPVHEKTLKENNTAIFTMVKPYTGLPTFGDMDVRTGQFPEFLHRTISARTISSPAFPAYSYESADNFKRVATPEEQITLVKSLLERWMARQFDLDGFNALLQGQSANLWDNQNGGLGNMLPGNGRVRYPTNTIVGNASSPTAIHWDATEHNRALATALDGLASASAPFTYVTHCRISELVDYYRLTPVKLDGQQFRAVVLTDPRNMYSLRRDTEFRNLNMYAAPRSEKNFVLYSRDFVILDDIIYLPTEVLKWFAPTNMDITAGTVNFGCGFTVDPRAGFVNPSSIGISIVLGAGALSRARRFTDLRYSQEVGRHGKGSPEFAVTWDDGWLRTEWYTLNGSTRNDIYCDTSFTVFNSVEASNDVI